MGDRGSKEVEQEAKKRAERKAKERERDKQVRLRSHKAA